MGQMLLFLEDPDYKFEILFWRVKVESGSPTDELANILRQTFAPYMVDNPGNATLTEMTLTEIWNQSTVGNIVVMSYDWSAPAVEPGMRQGWIWDYLQNQVGSYSDAKTMNGMLSKCNAGQIPKLIKYKQAAFNNTAHKLIGVWWTFTTGDVQSNTASQWASYPNALNDFYTINNGEIGNVLISDFLGDYPLFMQIVWDYNYYKYATFPPNDPATGYFILNDPPLPGTAIFQDPAACDNSGSDNATKNWVTVVIGVFVLVVLLICIIVCGIPCAIYCNYKRRKRESDFVKL